jgi:hypothetical protein
MVQCGDPAMNLASIPKEWSDRECNDALPVADSISMLGLSYSGSDPGQIGDHSEFPLPGPGESPGPRVLWPFTFACAPAWLWPGKNVFCPPGSGPPALGPPTAGQRNAPPALPSTTSGAPARASPVVLKSPTAPTASIEARLARLFILHLISSESGPRGRVGLSLETDATGVAWCVALSSIGPVEHRRHAGSTRWLPSPRGFAPARTG